MYKKERGNFYRLSTVIVDHGKESLSAVLDNDLSNTNMTFEDFINTNQHEIFHLCHTELPCCQCPNGIVPKRYKWGAIHSVQLGILLDKNGLLLKTHEQKAAKEYQYCCRPAKRSLSYTDVDITLLHCLLANFSETYRDNFTLREDIKGMVGCRNTLYAHVTEGRLTDTVYTHNKSKAEHLILQIARFCKIYKKMKQKLYDTSKRSLDESLLEQYQITLMQQIIYDRDIKEHLTALDEAMECSTRIIVDKISKEADHGRSMIIDQSEACLADHSEDDTYVITENVKLCCDILDKYKTLVIIAKAGGGKSKTSRQIARMYQEKMYTPMLFVNDEVANLRKLINFKESNIIIAEDLFGRSNIDFNEDLHRGILDILHSNFQRQSCKSKLIITVRGNDKIKQKLVKNHKMFENDVFINLDDTLSVQCKTKILSEHMKKNKISLCDCEKGSHYPKILCSREVFETSDKSMKICSVFSRALCGGEYEIQIGFPQACYFFCCNKQFTKQGKAYFTRTSQALVHEMNCLKKDGFKDKEIQYRYCVLVYAAIENTIDLDNIDELNFLKILTSIYRKDNKKITNSLLEDAVRDLEGTYVCKKIIKSPTEGIKRQKIAEKYMLQHNTILEAVFISYSIDADILPFCDFKFLQEYIRPKGYTDELNESMVLTFVNYESLVERLISMLSIDNNTCLGIGRYLNDIALQHQQDEIIQCFFQNLKDVEPEQYTCLLNGLTNFGKNRALVKLHPKLCTEVMVHAGSYVFVALCRPIGFVDNDVSFVAMETDLLINTLCKLFGKREIPELGFRNDLSEVGNYVFEYLIVNKFVNIVDFFFQKLKQNNLQIIAIEIKDFLDGLLCKGERSSIISQYKDFFEEVLFKYGSIPVITKLCRPLTSTTSNQNIIKIDDKLLAGKLSAHLEPTTSTQTFLRENGKYFVFKDHINFIETIALYITKHGFNSNNVKFVQVMYDQLIAHEKEQNSDTGSVDNENIDMTDESSNHEVAKENCAVNGKKVVFDGYPGDELRVDANDMVIESLSQVKVGSVKNVYDRHYSCQLCFDKMTYSFLFKFLSHLKSMLNFSTPGTLIGLLKMKFERLLDNINKKKSYFSSDSSDDYISGDDSNFSDDSNSCYCFDSSKLMRMVDEYALIQKTN